MEHILRLNSNERFHEMKEIKRDRKKSYFSFENQIWLLMNDMEFDLISSRGFILDISKKGGASRHKKFSVVASKKEVIGDIVLAIDCQISKKTVEGIDPKEFSYLRDHKRMIGSRLKRILGDEQQILYIFWLKNVLPTEENFEDAKRIGVTLLDEFDFNAYKEIMKSLGAATRYQLMADVCPKKFGSNMKTNRVPAICSTFGSTKAFYFLLAPERLIPLATVPRRRPTTILGGSTKREDNILYQRMLIPKKLRGVRKFVTEGDGFFPNNIVVGFSEKPKFSTSSNLRGVKTGLLTLPNSFGSITVIDGQHRLFGYSGIESDDHLVPVVGFPKLRADQQGKMFVDINSNQKKVDSNVLWDLQEYFGGSTKSAVSRIAKELNRRPESPLHGMIWVPSESPRKKGVPLKMTTICSTLQASNVLTILNNERTEFKENDIERCCKAIIRYYECVRDHSAETKADWKKSKDGYLCTNNGISTMMFVFEALLRNLLAEASLEGSSQRSTLRDPPETIDMIEKKLGKGLDYLMAYDDSQLSALRKSSSRGQQVETASEIEAHLEDTFEGFKVYHRKVVKGVRPTDFEKLLQELIEVEFRKRYEGKWYKHGLSEDVRERIKKTIRKKGKDARTMSQSEKMEYTDLGSLHQIILSTYRVFSPAFSDKKDVFDAKMSYINAWRSGRPGVHTGEVERYRKLMGRGAMGEYYQKVQEYLKNLEAERMDRLLSIILTEYPK